MPENTKILLVDDDPKFQKLARHILEKCGFEVIVCCNGGEARQELASNRIDLVISDYMMPNMNGLELLKSIRQDGYDVPFILVTAYGSIESTMEAMELGTVEYLTKPCGPNQIVLAVQKAFNIGEIRKELSRLQTEVEVKYSFENLVGQSPSMQEVYRIIHKASISSSNVLITGETGTGKEMAARAIHYNGIYKKGPFISVNCSAFSKGTLESELFGHVKGAFTDAHRDHKGRFELAGGGTLFLDEVGDIFPSIQVKLLRVLQEKQFERVGGQTTLHSNFRLIAATNKNLKDLVAKEMFREDLYYRLSVINLTMPPLREHAEDIPLLIKYFLKHYAQINSKDICTLSLEAMKLMQNYDWPGNVRQLENAIESAVAMCEGNMLNVHDLPLELEALPSEKPLDDFDYSNGRLEPLSQAVARVEKRLIRSALAQNGGVKARAAKALGVSERVLSYKVKKYGLKE